MSDEYSNSAEMEAAASSVQEHQAQPQAPDTEASRAAAVAAAPGEVRAKLDRQARTGTWAKRLSYVGAAAALLGDKVKLGNKWVRGGVALLSFGVNRAGADLQQNARVGKKATEQAGRAGRT